MIMQLPVALLAPAEGGGLNPLDVGQGGAALWTVLIFAFAAPFMWKIVMGPVTRALEERDSKASEAILVAQKASADAEAARSEVEVRLGEARAESAQLLAEARSRAEIREREILDAAQSEARSLLDAAQRTITAEKEKALAAIREEVVDMSLAAARVVIQRKVDTEDDRRLAGEVVGRLKSGSGKGGGA